VRAFEIHEQVQIPEAHQCVTHYVTRLDLARYPNLDAMRRSFNSASINRKIKKAEKSGLRILKGSTEEHFMAFDELQVETRRRQGSPAYPPRFFCMLAEELTVDEVVHLYLVYQDRRPVAGVLFLYDPQGATYGYGASVNEREIWQLGANQLAMWAAIREAHERGLPQVSFGTTPLAQRELREYKERWGAESEELAYTVGNDKERTLEVKRAGLLFRLASGALTRMPDSLFRWVSRPLTRLVT
jgi:lipid II:glycine glycyltransferase (peptidoglycan interpeptide bridge formation enzyme)